MPRSCRSLAILLWSTPLTLAVQKVHGAGHNKVASPVAALYANLRWLSRGIGGELLTNIGGRGGPEWQRDFRGRRAPMEGGGDVAIVTGATGGIGAEVATGLASCGYHVVVAARDTSRGRSLVSKIRLSGGRAEFVEALQIKDGTVASANIHCLLRRPSQAHELYPRGTGSHGFAEERCRPCSCDAWPAMCSLGEQRRRHERRQGAHHAYEFHRASRNDRGAAALAEAPPVSTCRQRRLQLTSPSPAR
jgi:hypothetical protein